MATVGTSYTFSLDSAAEPTAVAQVVSKQGLAHLPGFLSAATTDRLAEECRAVLDDCAPWVNHEEYGLGKAVRLVRKEIDGVRYPTLVEVFADPHLEEIAAAYYGKGYAFAEQIWVMIDVPESRTIVQEFHYDKVQHLKEMLYLTDVTLDHGPFHCVPGSQGIARVAQAENRANGIIPTDTQARVLPDGLRDQEIPVAGERGTLIVFDSDIGHRASVPTAGPRLVARSLTFGPESLGTRL